MITGPRMDEITDMGEQTALICYCFSLSVSLSCSFTDTCKEVLMDSLSNVQYKQCCWLYVMKA